MPTNAVISTGRRLAGSAALVATAAGLGTLAVWDRHWIEWGLLAFAGAVGLAGVGLGRRSMVSQVLSRGAAWTVLAPSMLVAGVTVASGHPEWMAIGLAASSGSALLLSRPMMNTAEAHAEFAPSSFRRWLTASAVAASAAGIITGVFGLDSFRWHPVAAISLVMLALSLLASAVGVVRMRAWGILLGALTTVVTLLAGLWQHDAAGFAVALASLPGMMMILPVLIAKRERAKVAATAGSFTRVAAHVSYDDAPRIRVATAADSSATGFDDDLDSSDTRAVSPPAAARLQA